MNSSGKRRYSMAASQCWVMSALVIVFTVSCGGQPPERLSEDKPAGTYLVVSLVDSTSEFYAAAEMLTVRHAADVVVTSPASPGSVIEEIRKREPEFVAFVINPQDLDINLVNRIFVLSTEVDPDPFVDFAWGVITGRDGAAAKKLVMASNPDKDRPSPSIAMFGVGGAGLQKSMTQKTDWPLGTGSLAVTNFLAKGETDADRDTAFIAEAMSSLGSSPIVLLASHGYPDGLVAGPKAADLRETDLTGCVVLNIACYTGVTSNWFDEDFQQMKIRKNSTDPSESFCLQVIDCGVAGYFAYTCPRPAGPTMMGEALLVATSGASLGEVFREDLQSVVMAHLLSGDDRVNVPSLTEGDSIEGERTPASVVKKMSIGGVLFGDPAFCPFPAKENSDPRVLEVNDHGDRITADLRIRTPLIHLFASDQINYWDGQNPAMRMECRLPVGTARVEKVDVVSVPEGIDEYRWVAAIEHSAGQRFLRWKLNFAQPADPALLQKVMIRGLSTQIEIHKSGGELADDTIIRGTSPEKTNENK